MTKKLLTTTAIFLFAFSANSFAQMKIGYMNTQQVLSQLPERQQVQDSLQAFVQQRQAELKKRATEYQDAIADYQSNKASMSQQQMKTREDELTALQKSLQQYDQTIQQEVQQKRQDLLSPIFERIDNAISTIAKSKDLDLVLNKSTNSGEQLLFYASQNQTDITQSVVQQLTSNSKN